jgi:hypothetical protein
MNQLRKMTLGLIAVLGSVTMFGGEPQHGLASGKRMHDPVTVAPPANKTGQPGMAVKGQGVPEHVSHKPNVTANGDANKGGAGRGSR